MKWYWTSTAANAWVSENPLPLPDVDTKLDVAWANAGAGTNAVPTRSTDLRNFAYAAARRYSGVFRGDDGVVLPAVKEWLAWNEPNNPVFLTPQYKYVKKHWVVQSAIDYARICEAVYAGVHAARVGSGYPGLTTELGEPAMTPCTRSGKSAPSSRAASEPRESPYT